jgi:hypothetical protein
MIKILLIILISTGCRHPSDTDAEVVLHVDEELKELFNNFIEDANFYGNAKKIAGHLSVLGSVTFKEIYTEEERTLGTCRRYRTLQGDTVTYSEIFIDPSLKSDPIKLKAVVYHELGHCLLGLEHVTYKIDLMNAQLLHKSYLEVMWDELVYELFN